MKKMAKKYRIEFENAFKIDQKFASSKIQANKIAKGLRAKKFLLGGKRFDRVRVIKIKKR